MPSLSRRILTAFTVRPIRSATSASGSVPSRASCSAGGKHIYHANAAGGVNGGRGRLGGWLNVYEGYEILTWCRLECRGPFLHGFLYTDEQLIRLPLVDAAVLAPSGSVVDAQPALALINPH